MSNIGANVKPYSFYEGIMSKQNISCSLIFVLTLGHWNITMGMCQVSDTAGFIIIITLSVAAVKYACNLKTCKSEARWF